MREIKSGSTVMRIRASALTIFLFKQEFGTDILKTVNGLFDSASETGTQSSIPNGCEFLQVLWALNKTQNIAENVQTPNFEQWLQANPDISVTEVMWDVLGEAMQGFFRISLKKRQPAG